MNNEETYPHEPRPAMSCTCPPPAAGGIAGVNRGHLLGCPTLSDYDQPCRGCDCAEQAPRDPNDPGAYPGPDPECDCPCHEDGQPL
jgi:hypothetical protein